eukprot:TRINITY_DN15239_c0_g1_i1.p1 TRINITY_DN15239_c0_g1~~TRINITY_DN15239_c0_g1_i1.p1  ORF type:complete len:141 (-),score=21.82 TRINITY_DN15239_c0_g1_i1:69-491(-)
MPSTTPTKPWTSRLFFLHALLAFIIGAALYAENEQFLKVLSAKVSASHYHRVLGMFFMLLSGINLMALFCRTEQAIFGINALHLFAVLSNIFVMAQYSYEAGKFEVNAMLIYGVIVVSLGNIIGISVQLRSIEKSEKKKE